MTDLVIDFDRYESKYQLHTFLKTLSGEQCIQVRKKKSKRSLAQNRYYWGVVMRYIATETGYNKYIAHLILLDKFLPYAVFEDDYELTSTQLDTEEMWEYIDLIRAWSFRFLNCLIPDPNQTV